MFLLAAAGAAAAGWYVLIIGTALFLILHIIKVRRQLGNSIYFLLFFYFLSYLNAVHQQALPSIDSYISEYHKIPVTARGRLEQVTVRTYGVELKLSACTVTVQPAEQNVQEDPAQYSAPNMGLLVQLQEKELAEGLIPGQIVSVTGKIQAFCAARNDGEFDSKQYYRSIGINYRVYADEITVCGSPGALRRRLEQFREKVGGIYRQIADEKDAALVSAMVLGEKSGLDDDTRKLYQENGIAHLLAISGLHVSLIGMFVYRMLKRSGAGCFTAFAWSAVLLAGYIVLTGDGVSARRAVVMCVLNMGADVMGRTYDLLSALSASMMLAAFENIWVLYQFGFLLSYGALLGIALLTPALDFCLLEFWRTQIKRIDKKRNAFLRWTMDILLGMGQSLVTSAAVSLMTLPVILYGYFEVPVYSVLLNIVVIPLMSVLMLCALLAGLAGFFYLPAASFFMGTVHFILRLYETLCHIVNLLPVSSLMLGRPTVFRCVMYYGILTVFMAVMYFVKSRKLYCQNLQEKVIEAAAVWKMKRQAVLKRAGIVLLVLPFALTVLVWQKETKLIVDMIDVGQGDCILVRAPDHTVWLFDGGSSDIKNVGENRIYPLLCAKAVTEIDYVFISHADEDHINGIIELFDCMDENFAIKNLVLPEIQNAQHEENYMRLCEQAQQAGIQIQYVHAGDRFYSKDAVVQMACLHPVSGYAYQNSNDYSAVYLLQYHTFSMLFTGDVEAAGENAFLSEEQITPVSVLKVAHHGSKTSTTQALLAQAKPQLALVSCGINNQYGHPSDETIQRLEASNACIFATPQHGQITIKTDGRRFWVFRKIAGQKG